MLARLAAGDAAPREACRLVVLVLAVVMVVGLVGVRGVPAARGSAAIELLDFLQELLRLFAELGFLGTVEVNDLVELGVQGAPEDVLRVLNADERSGLAIPGGCLVSGLFELVNPGRLLAIIRCGVLAATSCAQGRRHGRIGWIAVQLLEVAVSQVLAAPVRHSVELYAMRELHLVLLVQAPNLVPSLLALSSLAVSSFSPDADVDVAAELVLVHGLVGCVVVEGVCVPSSSRCSWAGSSTPGIERRRGGTPNLWMGGNGYRCVGSWAGWQKTPASRVLASTAVTRRVKGGCVWAGCRMGHAVGAKQHSIREGLRRGQGGKLAV